MGIRLALTPSYEYPACLHSARSSSARETDCIWKELARGRRGNPSNYRQAVRGNLPHRCASCLKQPENRVSGGTIGAALETGLDEMVRPLKLI